MATCGIAWAGWTAAVSRYEFVRLRPGFAGVIVCDGGAGQVLVKGNWQACGTGQAYLLPAGEPHAYKATRGRRWSICWVAFNSAPRASAAPARFEGPPQLVTADPRPVRGAIEGLRREVTGPADPAAIHSWVELIQLYALRIVRRQSCDQDRLWRLWERVDADLAHPWCVEELAGTMSTSNEHLRRLCRAGSGRSPMNHVTHLRVRRAAALLVSTNQKVDTIARAVGYHDPFAFSVAFRRHTGESPSNYRRLGESPSSR